MKKETQNLTVAQLRTEVENSWEKIQSILKDSEEDLTRFLKGNSAAGTRVRKALQEVKIKSQDVRLCVQDIKNKK